MDAAMNQRINDAIDGLKEYYSCLETGTLLGDKFVSYDNRLIFWINQILVEETGNNQLDYEAIRDKVEFAAQKFENILNLEINSVGTPHTEEELDKVRKMLTDTHES